MTFVFPHSSPMQPLTERKKRGKNKVDLVLLFIYVGASDFCDSFLFDARAPNIIAQNCSFTTRESYL